MAGPLIWLNVGVVEKGFAIFDARESVADVRFASADGFDLTALQREASLVALENVIVAQCLAIENRLSRHIEQARCLCSDLGAVGRIFDRFVGELAGDDFLERDVGREARGPYFTSGRCPKPSSRTRFEPTFVRRCCFGNPWVSFRRSE